MEALMPVPAEWSLAGRKALVAGVARGWAAPLAGALAEAGADVAVAGTDPEAVREGVDAVRVAGRRAFGTTGRWDSTEAVDQTVRQVVGELLGLQILVNGPGMWLGKPFASTTEDEWAAVLDANLMAPVRWCRAAGTHFLSQGHGRIVNVVSVLAERGMANSTAYAATQAGTRAVTQSLALEWARAGVCVNGVGIGWYDLDGQPTEEQQKERLVRYLPLRRKGRPADVAALTVYLASDACSFVTGQTVFVDGGALAHA
jgi:2-deoxy-D-gluconate 3-dehydrogenase